MKNLIVIGLVGVILFGISAGVSWFVVLPRMAETEEIEPEGDDQPDDATATPAMPQSVNANDKPDAMPVSLRPEIPVTVEAVTELAQSIMKKEGRLIESEKQLKREEKRIGLLFEDLKQERKELTAFSQRIDAQVIEAREAAELLKMEKQQLEEQKKTLSTLEQKTGTSLADAKGEEIKQRAELMKSWFEKMEPELAAKYLKEFADRGDLELAAQVIDNLDTRQIAKVLAEINDPPLVAQIVEAFTKNKKVGGEAVDRTLR